MQCGLSEEIEAAIVQSNKELVHANKELVQKNKELLEAIPELLLQMAGNGTMESRGSQSGVQTTTTGAESRGPPSAASQYAHVSSGSLNDGQGSDNAERERTGEAAASEAASGEACEVEASAAIPSSQPDWKGMKTYDAWVLWHFGNAGPGHRPFKQVKGTDFSPATSDGRRLSDLRYLIKVIERKAKALNIYNSDPDQEEADFIYQQCENVLMEEYQRVTRLRGLEAIEGRFSELSWMTVSDLTRPSKQAAWISQ